MPRLRPACISFHASHLLMGLAPHSGKGPRYLAVLVALALAAICPAFTQDTPLTAQEIVQRSVEANARDWNAAPQYDNMETDREPNGGTRTVSTLMIEGSPYNRLMQINGEPLPPQQQAQEQQKLDAVIARRQQESAQERAARIAKYQKDRASDHALMDELTKAFNFTLTGEETLDGHDVYALKATPRPGYQPPSMATQVLTGMQGKLWIDKKTFQWVKVTAQVIHPVSIEGFLAQVEPGTRFELEKMPVGDEIWLPSHFSMTAHARVLFLFSHNASDNERYYDYHKAEPLQASGLSK